MEEELTVRSSGASANCISRKSMQPDITGTLSCHAGLDPASMIACQPPTMTRAAMVPDQVQIKSSITGGLLGIKNAPRAGRFSLSKDGVACGGVVASVLGSDAAAIQGLFLLFFHAQGPPPGRA
jgi:hypothetical protein